MRRLEQIKLRVNNYLFIACLLFFCMGTAITANGQSANLKGTWNIDQVKIKKTVNGVATEKTYSTRERIESFVSCPQKVTFKADNKVIFEYSGQEPRESEYIIEGGKVKIMTAAAAYEYGYAITGTNAISLTRSVSYSYNRDNEPSDKITEEYTFQGHKE